MEPEATLVPRFWVRAPDHLGDGILALPAIAALANLRPTTVEGPSWTRELYAGVNVAFGLDPEAQTAVLFKPSFSAAWRARRHAKRVGISWDLRGPLLTTAVADPGGHRLQSYAAISNAAGATATGLPTLPLAAKQPNPEVDDDTVLLLPGTASGPTVRWPHFRALADRLGSERIVWAGGPGDEAILEELAGTDRVVHATTLHPIAALAVAAKFVVGNDAGLSHLAAAAIRGAGQDPQKVHIVYGSTAPERTGPPGTTPHTTTPPSCWPCYQKHCDIGTPCLEVPVDGVWRALAG